MQVSGFIATAPLPFGHLALWIPLYNPYMNIAALIAQYGYAAAFLGPLFEGETVLLLAGYAAHRGYLDFAGLGAVTGDQFFFWLGRRHAKINARSRVDQCPAFFAARCGKMRMTATMNRMSAADAE
jgi:hypothetical protein